ncbi:7-cyano-7-deazaguanine synthase [Mycolicibacter arupensis]|uniref:7-cyano-7-deazaguanine synthase n=1 Tax=Mycolicibacter arupensis TaxID=342002 RepID=UPI00165ED295
MTTTALLLSGGIDSAAVAAWKHPDIALFIDYGQRSAFAERRAARAVAAELGIRHHELTVGLDALGAGVLKDDVTRDGWPSPEWWPYRNQLLVTCAAAWLTTNAEILEIKMPPQARILMGTVSSDASRHRDGSFRFFEALNECGHLTWPHFGRSSSRILAPPGW